MRRCSRPARSRKGRVRRCDGVAACRDAQRVVAVGQRSRERSHEVQVANDVASAKESQVVKPAQAGALTTPLPESCRAASSARIASRALWSVVSLAESAAFVAYEASSAASALEAWSAVMPASRLASCAATKALVARPSVAFAILVSTSSGVSNPSTVESREASALVSALPARAASRAAVVTASRRAAAILESTSEEVSTAESCQGAGVRLGGLQPRDGGVGGR